MTRSAFASGAPVRRLLSNALGPSLQSIGRIQSRPNCRSTDPAYRWRNETNRHTRRLCYVRRCRSAKIAERLRGDPANGRRRIVDFAHQGFPFPGFPFSREASGKDANRASRNACAFRRRTRSVRSHHERTRAPDGPYAAASGTLSQARSFRSPDA